MQIQSLGQEDPLEKESWSGLPFPSPLTYLASVTCGMDITSPDYLTIRFFSIKEFTEALGLAEDEDLTQLRADSDEAGYVKTIQIGKEQFSGDEVRKRLELPSPCFYIKEVEGKMRVVVKGK